MADTRSRQLPTCTTAPNWIGESNEDSPTRGASVVVAARDSEVVVVVSVGVAGGFVRLVFRGCELEDGVAFVISAGVCESSDDDQHDQDPACDQDPTPSPERWLVGPVTAIIFDWGARGRLWRRWWWDRRARRLRGYHFPSLACHQPSPCDASAPPFAMVDHLRMLLGGRLGRSTVCCLPCPMGSPKHFRYLRLIGNLGMTKATCV